MKIYPETKVVRSGDWYRVYVLSRRGWIWHVASRSKRAAKRIAVNLKLQRPG